ncbi:MAG: ADP-ribosylglycohydrolase family protein [Candidatus Omnitrophica bacterium]|nr:ADP-ribosylglycohydrolase family protein [Candidatus Omnitrophota bacterium]
MSNLVLNKETYRDKVYACWIGKNIGGTLGAPWELMRHTHAFTFYEPLPNKAAPNDDLDLQLVWLKMLEDEGIDPSVRTFAEYWSRYTSRYPWNEYGFFMRNFDRGLRPPVAGCFENYFVDEMGSPIRSEIWACLYPGDPQAAGRMAWKDSAVDHTGGEGMYGEIFWASLQSAAFVENDTTTLIQLGLNMIPISSHVGRAIREALWCYENGKTWGEARERIVERFGHIQPCHAVPNHGFTIIGWLYGKDFGDKLCKAVNCGYDTDCTGATLGALLGIIGGTAGIPKKWSAPVGDEIVLHKFTGNCNPPKTVSELTERTIALAEKSLKANDSVSFGNRDVFPKDLRTRLFRNDLVKEALKQNINAGVELIGKTEVWLDYGGEPVIRQGIGKEIEVSTVPGPTPLVNISVPDGWNCERLGPARFRLLAPQPVARKNHISVSVNGKKVDFVILGPDEAKGFAAGVCVPSCPRCQARVEACMCKSHKLTQ